MRAHQPERDLPGLQQLDQVGPGHVEELRRLLRGQLGRLRHDGHPLAARQVSQDLGQQDRRLPRHRQRVFAGEFPVDRDRVSARMGRQVLTDLPGGALSKLRVPVPLPDFPASLAGHRYHL
jgi:hypothetical protein